MSIGLRGKLFGVAVLLIAIVGLSSGVYLEHLLRQWVVSRIETDVLKHAKSARALLETNDPPDEIREMDPIADRMKQTTGARVTIIDSDGTVLGDSSLDVEGVRKVENHADRPEVQAALDTGSGTSRRFSSTVGREMLYVAVPYRTRTGHGVVRASLPVSDVGHIVRRLRIFMAAAALLGLVVAVFASGLASHLVSRNFRSIVSRAEDMVREEPGDGPEQLTLPIVDVNPSQDSVEDLSERLEVTVNELGRQRDRLEAILESMSEAVIVVDALRKVELVNSAAADLLMLTSDPTGQPLSTLLDDPAVEKLYDDATRGEQPSVEFGIEREEPLSLIAQAAREPATGSVVIVMHDVTELRRLEQIRRDFVANISHELRTPVSIIQANAETLKNGALEDPEHAPRFLDSLMRTSERMADLVDDLLDISRLESGSYDINKEPVALRPLVEQTFADVERKALDKELELSNDVEANLSVMADRKALTQVLLNLVENAVKYTPASGRIWIRAQVEGDEVVVKVHDNGRGVPEEDRDRVFERFYRVDPGRSRDEGGTGLGLSIVKHLVENMDGEVGYRPAKVRGSIFWFRLPLAASVKPTAPDTAS